MKIGTLSLNINAPDFNYGAMLHSWAFQKYLKSLDCVESVEVIDYKMPKVEDWNRLCPKEMRPTSIKECKKFFMQYPYYYSRMRKFDKFIQNYLDVSKKRYVQKTITNAELPYDTLICESDVIWCAFRGNFDPTFFLACDSMKEKKRIAYCPSMADAVFTEEQEEQLDALLEGIDHISFRESYMEDILKKHTQKPVEHVVDPVMLLNPEDYDCITAPRLMEEKYILLYMPVNINKTLRKEAKQYAKKNGYKILEISTKLKSKKKGIYTCIPDAGIEEFLSAVKYAEIVFTNSFHAVCFSILFERQFYAFTRKTNGKVRDVCEQYGLSEFYLKDDQFVELKPYDREKVRETYRNLQSKSRLWLKNALEN